MDNNKWGWMDDMYLPETPWKRLTDIQMSPDFTPEEGGEMEDVPLFEEWYSVGGTPLSSSPALRVEPDDLGILDSPQLKLSIHGKGDCLITRKCVERLLMLCDLWGVK